MEVVLLADRPDLMAPLAAAYQAQWPDWYGPGGPGDAQADLHLRARRESLPLGLVLVDGETVLGALAITETGVEGYEHLGPWVGGGWVQPSMRRQGLGARLLRAAVEQAGRMGIARLYVATATAGSLMARVAGWRLVETIAHPGGDLSLFVIEIGAGQGGGGD